MALGTVASGMLAWICIDALLATALAAADVCAPCSSSTWLLCSSENRLHSPSSSSTSRNATMAVQSSIDVSYLRHYNRGAHVT